MSTDTTAMERTVLAWTNTTADERSAFLKALVEESLGVRQRHRCMVRTEGDIGASFYNWYDCEWARLDLCVSPEEYVRIPSFQKSAEKMRRPIQSIQGLMGHLENGMPKRPRSKA